MNRYALALLAVFAASPAFSQGRGFWIEPGTQNYLITPGTGVDAPSVEGAIICAFETAIIGDPSSFCSWRKPRSVETGLIRLTQEFTRHGYTCRAFERFTWPQGEHTERPTVDAGNGCMDAQGKWQIAFGGLPSFIRQAEQPPETQKAQAAPPAPKPSPSMHPAPQGLPPESAPEPSPPFDWAKALVVSGVAILLVFFVVRPIIRALINARLRRDAEAEEGRRAAEQAQREERNERRREARARWRARKAAAEKFQNDANDI